MGNTSPRPGRSAKELQDRLAELEAERGRDVHDQHVVSKLLIKRFAVASKIESISVVYPHAKPRNIGPKAAGKVIDFVSFASASDFRVRSATWSPTLRPARYRWRLVGLATGRTRTSQRPEGGWVADAPPVTSQRARPLSARATSRVRIDPSATISRVRGSNFLFTTDLSLIGNKHFEMWAICRGVVCGHANTGDLPSASIDYVSYPDRHSNVVTIAVTQWVYWKRLFAYHGDFGKTHDCDC